MPLRVRLLYVDMGGTHAHRIYDVRGDRAASIARSPAANGAVLTSPISNRMSVEKRRILLRRFAETLVLAIGEDVLEVFRTSSDVGPKRKRRREGRQVGSLLRGQSLSRTILVAHWIVQLTEPVVATVTVYAAELPAVSLALHVSDPPDVVPPAAYATCARLLFAGALYVGPDDVLVLVSGVRPLWHAIVTVSSVLLAVL